MTGRSSDLRQLLPLPRKALLPRAAQALQKARCEWVTGSPAAEAGPGQELRSKCRELGARSPRPSFPHGLPVRASAEASLT